MHRYLVVRFKNIQSKSKMLERVQKYIIREIPFEPQHISVNLLGENTLLISAVASDIFGIDRFVSEDKTLLFDGFAFHNAEFQTADKLKRILSSELLDAARSIQGQYSVVNMNGGVITASEDSSGSRPIYYVETPEWVAISNKQSLLSPICLYDGYRAIDLNAAGWLIGQCHIFDDRSIYQGVKLLKPGNVLRVDANGDLRIVKPSEQIWTVSKEKISLTGADYDDATHDLVQSYKSIRSVAPYINGDVSLSLTGGKDSRLGLALAKEAGLLNDVTLFTYGDKNSAEVQVARHLADIIGKEHKAIPTDPFSELNIDQIWRRLRYAAYRFDFSHGGVDGGFAPAKGTVQSLDLTGSFADIFRRVWPHSRTLKFNNFDEAFNRWKNWPLTHDQLGLLKGGVKEAQFAHLKDWLEYQVSLGYDLNDLQEIYYIENRMTWWAGAINTANIGRLRLMPLSSFQSSKTGMMLGAEDRQRERLHFEVLKRLSPELCSAGFLRDTWHEDIRKENPRLFLAAAPYPVDEKAVPTAPAWFNYFITEDINTIREYLLGSPSTGLFDIVDYHLVEKALANPKACTGVIQPRQIINMLLIQMALQRDNSYPKDDVRRGTTVFETNIPGFELSWESILVESGPKIGKTRKLTFNVPAAKTIRLDPTNQPGIIKLSNLTITDKGVSKNLSFKDAKLNSHIVPLSVKSESGVFESVGNDPNLLFAVITNSPVSIQLEALVEAGDYFDVHWDDGMGFSAEKRIRISL